MPSGLANLCLYNDYSMPSVGPASMVGSIAAGARRIEKGQRAGRAIEVVRAAVQRVVPGDLALGDLRRKRVGGAPVVVDLNLKSRSTFWVGALEGDGRRVSGVRAACRA